jgi:excisionase family DNA binding protein
MSTGIRRSPMERLLLRPAEAAETLGISRSRLYQLLAAGHLPVIRVGQSMRVPVQELERWVAAQLAPVDSAPSTVGSGEGVNDD